MIEIDSTAGSLFMALLVREQTSSELAAGRDPFEAAERVRGRAERLRAGLARQAWCPGVGMVDKERSNLELHALGAIGRMSLCAFGQATFAASSKLRPRVCGARPYPTCAACLTGTFGRRSKDEAIDNIWLRLQDSNLRPGG